MNFFKHLHTINKHRFLVMRYCFKCHLFKQGLLHDLSKYSFTEFFNSVKYYQGTYSPTINERKDKGYSDVWLHHKGRNKHHAEYWSDVSVEDHLYHPIPMPKKYLVESFCDRLAACKVYRKKTYEPQMALDYLLNEKYRLPIHEDSFNDLKMLLEYYVLHGEKEVFKYIRNVYLKK